VDRKALPAPEGEAYAVRGYEEPEGEIEAKLAEREGVREAVVVAREETPGEKRLVAYYTVAGEEWENSVGAKELREHLRRSLPEYMAPAAYVRLERLPLTPNGKVVRKALPAPEADAYGARAYEAPVGELETILTAVWCKALKIDRVGRRDNFFLLGGHSLLAMQVVSLLEREGIHIQVTDLFARQTIESLAAALELQDRRTDADKAICIRKSGSKRPLFLVHEGAGDLTYLFALAPHIDSDIPVYGLPAKPASETPLRTIEGMAARMVRMIREVRPVGPYCLAGWSFGGVLAYEIAVQLMGADQEVEFLGLFDTSYIANNTELIKSYPKEFDDKDQLLRMLEYLIHSNSALDQNERLQSAFSEVKSSAATMDFAGLVQKCQKLPFSSEPPMHLTVEQLRQRLARIYYYDTANIEYSASPIPIPIHFFAAEDNNRGKPLRGWEAVLPENQTRLIPTPGTHLSMMITPNVSALGKRLSQAIRSATENSGKLPAPDEHYSPLVALRTGQPDVAPLVCVPGGGASVTNLVNLINSLNRKRHIFGFEPRGLDGVLIPHSTVPAAADAYLQSLRQTYPIGPVNLLGHSFGGWVAFEMANRLIESGRGVISLTILDSEAPSDSSLDASEFSAIEAIMSWIEIFELHLGRPLGVKRSDLQSCSGDVRLEILHSYLVKERLVPHRSAPDILCGPFRTFARALRTHFSPDKPYPGPMQLLLVDDPKLDRLANRRKQEQIEEGWKRWAPNLVLARVPGNHMSILNPPHVIALAQLIEMSIGR